MKEYIEREAVLAREYIDFTRYDDTEWQKGYWAGVDDICAHVKALPAADVVERKRGRWLEVDGEVFECDMCHRIHAAYEYNFCPECGSDMRSHHDSLCDQTEEVG